MAHTQLQWQMVCSFLKEASNVEAANCSAGIELYVSKDEEFLKYFDEGSTESCLKTLSDLEAYIEEDGPFDGVIAFSQGAALAASLQIHMVQKDQWQAHLYPLFKCAIFFSGGVPEDPIDMERDGKRRPMNYKDDGEVIGIPTAHIWGRNDTLYPTFGPVLSKLCKVSEREESIHDGGHAIPGPKDPVAVEHAVKMIKRTIGRAEALQ